MTQADTQDFTPLTDDAGSNIRKSLRHTIQRLLFNAIQPIAERIDSNWYAATVLFSDRATSCGPNEQNRCLTVNYTANDVLLVGPKHGHMLLSNANDAILPEALLAHLRVCDLMTHGSSRTIWNPKHNIRFVPGCTLILYEGKLVGAVERVDGFYVRVQGVTETVVDSRITYVHERQIKRQIRDVTGPAIGVSYLPLLPVDGVQMDTVEAISAQFYNMKSASPDPRTFDLGFLQDLFG